MPKQAAAMNPMNAAPAPSASAAVLQRHFSQAQMTTLLASRDPALLQARGLVDRMVRDRYPTETRQAFERQLVARATTVVDLDAALDTIRPGGENHISTPEAWSMVAMEAINPLKIGLRAGIGAAVGAGVQAVRKQDVKQGAKVGAVVGLVLHGVGVVLGAVAAGAVTAINASRDE